MTILKNLSIETLRELYKTNKQFADVIDDEAMRINMYWQGEWYSEMLGKNNRGYSHNNHYTSFYLRLTDAESFVADLPDTCKDYLPTKDAELYDRAKKLLGKWQDMTYDEQDANESVFTELETTATELLQAIENTLHEFETVDDEQIDSVLETITESGNAMSEWELLDDGKTIAEHIAKFYK